MIGGDHPHTSFQNPVSTFNYAETVRPMKDGLPVRRDFPAALGGSGEVVVE
jgi:hypothetical protein